MDMTIWDKIPEEMQVYLSRNGKHFNKRLCEWAVGKMRKGGKRLEPITKEQLGAIFKEAGKNLEDYDAVYDAVYLANMAKADFLGGCLSTNEQLAKYVDDVLVDDDGYEGMVLNRWLADMAGKGVWIDWERMI